MLFNKCFEKRIDEYKGISTEETYNPDFDHDAYVNSLEFLFEKEITRCYPYREDHYQAIAKFYKCPDCGKPFCFEDSVAFA